VVGEWRVVGAGGWWMAGWVVMVEWWVVDGGGWWMVAGGAEW
jgi:hypothetical protein